MRFLVLAALLTASSALGCDAVRFAGLAYHADRSHRFNALTKGVGCEFRSGDWRWGGMIFENSNYHGSNVFAVSYLPLHIGPVHAGIAGGKATGYKNDNDHQGLQSVGGFTAELMGREQGAEFTLIPRVFGMKGVVGWFTWKVLTDPMK